MHEFEVKSRICGETGRFLNRFKSEHKKHRAKTKRFQNRCPIRLLQLSTAGEVFSEGEKPSESPSADGETPCAVLLAHGEGG